MANQAKKQESTKIYSMASNDVVITTHVKPKEGSLSGARKIDQAIIIKGGANVAFSDKDKAKRKINYAVTEVTVEQLEILKANPAFMRKVNRGFITIGELPKENKRDKSAQLTEESVKAKAPKAKAKTGSVEAE